jgi:hypothetical protein
MKTIMILVLVALVAPVKGQGQKAPAQIAHLVVSELRNEYKNIVIDRSNFDAVFESAGSTPKGVTLTDVKAGAPIKCYPCRYVNDELAVFHFESVQLEDRAVIVLVTRAANVAHGGVIRLRAVSYEVSLSERRGHWVVDGVRSRGARN